MLFSQGTLVMHLSAFKWAVLLTFKENSTQKTLCNRKAEEVTIADWKGWVFMFSTRNMPIF